MHLRHPELLDESQRPLERGVVLGGKADDDVCRQVDPVEPLEPARERGDGVAPAHRTQNAVVARLERDVEVRRHGRRLPERGGQLVVDVVHLDGREPEALDTRQRAGLANEPGEGVAGLAVAEAAEVDAGEDDLAVPLLDASADLREHGRGGPAPGRPSHLRDHAEGAGERAAVLDPDERPPAVELVRPR